VPCSIKLLKAPKGDASFHDFEEFERLVEAARSEAPALLVALLGGEAGLRCGDPAVEDGHGNEPRGRGEVVEAAGTEGDQTQIARRLACQP
jgi:hypothetical protein